MKLYKFSKNGKIDDIKKLIRSNFPEARRVDVKLKASPDKGFIGQIELEIANKKKFYASKFSKIPSQSLLKSYQAIVKQIRKKRSLTA